MILVISIKQQEFDNKKWNSKIERANQTGWLKSHILDSGVMESSNLACEQATSNRAEETNIDEDTSYM